MPDDANQSILVVYGRESCSQSRMLRNLLDKEAVIYEWRDIVQGEEKYQDELRELAGGYLSVPTVVFPDGSVLVEPWPREVFKKLRTPPGFWEKLGNFFKKM